MRASIDTIRITAALQTAAGPVTARPGRIFRLSAGGHHGLGEASPLPAFGGEGIDACTAALRRAQGLLGAGLPPQRILDRLLTTPVARSAVLAALLDLAARQAGRPLARLLNPTAPLSVRANWLGPAVPPGWTVCKRKALADPVDSARMLRQLHQQHPHLHLRIDANGCWSPADYLLFARAAAGLPIDLVEQPCAPRHDRDLPWLQRQGKLPIALDESLRRPADLDRLLALRPAGLVIKPMLFGGADLTLAAARRIRAAGIRVIITDSICSPIGRHHAAHIAAACSPQEHHGLATASLLGQTDPLTGDRWSLHGPGAGP